ncbi:hypothetical protein lpymt_02447 [Legionella pneumophila]|nr:hypothetical protein lpymt_02447 [Legionella pneumophila]
MLLCNRVIVGHAKVTQGLFDTWENQRKCLILLVGPLGLEPRTNGL